LECAGDARETIFPAGCAFFLSPRAKHDGHELAKIMADGGDFVIVRARSSDGHADFENAGLGSPRAVAAAGVRG
jgi:hypothetical protein